MLGLALFCCKKSKQFTPINLLASPKSELAIRSEFVFPTVNLSSIRPNPPLWNYLVYLLFIIEEEVNDGPIYVCSKRFPLPSPNPACIFIRAYLNLAPDIGV